MKVGVFPPFANPFCTPEHVSAVGRAVDERGFSSLWVAEHVVLFDEYASQYPYLESGRFPARPDVGLVEPFATLAFLAAVTTNVRLGTGVLLVPQRNPVYTAKSVTTVDWLSNGRVDLGIGVGWLAEEFAALGVPFEHRGERCDEYLAVMRSLWTDEVSSFHGSFYDLPPARQFPKPVQQPHPPIHVGGESNAALRRAARLTEGWYGYNAGRQPSDVLVSVCPYMLPVTEAEIDAYAEAGVDQLVLYAPIRSTDDIERVLDAHAAVMNRAL
jgi:probable F420-dependent oxidoreductase